MPIALDLLELQQREVHLVVDDLIVGSVFGRKRVLLDGSQSIVKIGIELVLLVDARRAEVVDLFVQLHALVLVIAGGRGRDRRERQRSIDEVVGQARRSGLAGAACCCLQLVRQKIA